MANAHQLIDCFNDTMHRIQTDPFLRTETMKSKADTVVYPVFWDNNQAAYFAKWLYFDSCDVEVVADTTFSAARKYLHNGNEQKRVAVLNFANPHYAGGGVEHERTILDIQFENQMGTALIETVDAATGDINLAINVDAVPDLSNIRLKKLQLSYQAEASLQVGDALNFENDSRSASITVTSTTGETRN